jgi:hypothetical protein
MDKYKFATLKDSNATEVVYKETNISDKIVKTKKMRYKRLISV